MTYDEELEKEVAEYFRAFPWWFRLAYWLTVKLRL